MQPLETRIRHTIAVVQAAIENPAERPLREANGLSSLRDALH